MKIISEKQKTGKRDLLIQNAISLIIIFAWLTVFFKILMPGYLAAALVGAFGTVVLLFLSEIFDIYKTAVASLIIMVTAASGAFYSAFANGLSLGFNSAIPFFNEKLGLDLLEFSVQETTQLHDFLLVAIVASVVGSILVQHSVKYKNFTILALAPLSVVTLTALTAPKTTLLCGLCSILVCVGFIVVMANSNSEKVSVRKTAVFAALVCLILGASVILLPVSKYKPSAKVDDLKNGINTDVYNFRYASSLSGAEVIPYYSYPKGDFSSLSNPTFTDNTVISVKTQLLDRMYLRGYTGCNYIDSESRWVPLDKSAFAGNNTGIMRWLSLRDFYAQNQLASVYELAQSLQKSYITVQNVALSSDDIYVPYEYSPVGDLNAEFVDMGKDTDIHSKGVFGTRTYTFTTYDTDVTDYLSLSADKILKDVDKSSDEYRTYEKSEAVYRAFVYENYLDVSEENVSDIINLFGKDTAESIKGKSIQKITDFLRRYYRQYFTFDYYSGDGKSFLSDFTESRVGFDVHYATLSTLIFRYAGIPARYVEGYYIGEELATDYDETTDITIDLTDSNAHAWTEVYVAELGWIPVEVTPGYYDISNEDLPPVKNVDTSEQGGESLYIDEEDIEDETKEEPTSEENAGMALNYIILIIAISAVVLYIVSRLLYIYLRKKRMTSAEIVKAMSANYKYVQRLLVFDKIISKQDKRTVSLLSYADIVKLNYGVELELFAMSVYEAVYSNHKLEHENVLSAYEFSRNLSTKVFKNQSLLRKLIMKLILWL